MIFFYIISYHCMYSFFIFHPLFNSICYCLSIRLVFIFHFQKKTGSLLLPCFLIKKKKKLLTLSVVHTTLSVVYIIYSVSCKHLPSRLYTPQGQLCALFNQFHFQKKTGSLLLPCFLISKKKKNSTLSVVHTTLSVLYIIYSVSCKHCTHHKVSCVHYLISQL